MKKALYIFVIALCTTVLISCSKEKQCVCYHPNNETTHETAEECRFLNINEMWHDSALVVMKYCIEE